MIIVRAPMRIPIGGGGTDLPSYYSQFGGEWISAAMNKHTYVIVAPSFQPVYRLKYSKTEEVGSIDEIQHPIFREALRMLDVKPGIEIVSIADIPSNTGLGTSSSFTVALLAGLYAYLRNTKKIEMPSRQELAEQACHIAMNILKEPSGKQDEYAAAFGGLNTFYADKEGHVKVEPFFPIHINYGAMEELNHNLLMFYTGIRRESRDALSVQQQATQTGDQDMINNLHKVKEIGKEIRQALEKNDFHRFGELMDIHWQEKIKRKGTSDPRINQWYELAKENGAIGGKLMGAGGGGFFIFYVEEGKEKLRKVMSEQGLQEIFFNIDLEGVKIISDV